MYKVAVSVALLLGIAAGSARAGVTSDPAVVIPLAREAVAAVEADPRAPDRRKQVIRAFEGLVWIDPTAMTPAVTDLLGSALARVHGYALTGGQDGLAALMMANRAPWATTAGGAEWINELLWDTFEVRQQLTVDTLAAIPQADRRVLVDRVYTAPVHDGFDFAIILRGLKAARIPDGLETDINRIITALEVLAK
jgi:hypothetical protein